MTYDLHGGWESQTGIHAALFAGPNDPGTANVDYSIQLLLNMGVPRSKLIMGMASVSINEINIMISQFDSIFYIF